MQSNPLGFSIGRCLRGQCLPAVNPLWLSLLAASRVNRACVHSNFSGFLHWHLMMITAPECNQTSLASSIGCYSILSGFPSWTRFHSTATVCNQTSCILSIGRWSRGQRRSAFKPLGLPALGAAWNS